MSNWCGSPSCPQCFIASSLSCFCAQGGSRRKCTIAENSTFSRPSGVCEMMRSALKFSWSTDSLPLASSAHDDIFWPAQSPLGRWVMTDTSLQKRIPYISTNPSMAAVIAGRACARAAARFTQMRPIAGAYDHVPLVALVWMGRPHECPVPYLVPSPSYVSWITLRRQWLSALAGIGLQVQFGTRAMSSSELDGTKTLGQLKDAFVRFFSLLQAQRITLLVWTSTQFFQ